MSDCFARPTANENRDPCATLSGAYFHLLRARAHLRRQNATRMTAEQFREWRAALGNVEGVMREIEPRL
ncbi:hypothetical protein FTUN_2946 [Frigoriglobus tundricola]|uniref:Uncharacterized protein n=1 Tax=Frigoriglobus tundricola TaxID=2774151 RepID=A0A6M5YMX2_9BACT|nr:hypothetical protein FTUN_2946 [Frigoriglobus tundricola]